MQHRTKQPPDSSSLASPPRFLSCHVLSCHVLSCLVLSGLVLSGHVLSCSANPAAAARSGPPPRATLERLDAAMTSLDDETFTGSFTLTTRSTVSKVDGPAEHEERIEEHVTMPADGPARHQVVSAVRDGADATAAVQAERNAAAHEATGRAEDGADAAAGAEDSGNEKHDGEAEEHSVTLSASVPEAAELARYRFGAPEVVDGVLVASFEPDHDQSDDDDAATGRLAWDPETLDPLWIELSPSTRPKHVKTLVIRVELGQIEAAGQAGALYTRHIITDAVGGFLFFKRAIHAEVEISDVRPLD